MTPSQAETEDIGPDHPHLHQLGREVVASLCFESLRLAGSSTHVKLEVEAFKQSRTAWDATRLSNALWFFDPGHPDVADLVATIDREAEACAGFTLPNKMRRAS